MTTINTNGSARTLTIPNLVNGQIYRARVSAVNNYGQGPFANWIQVTPSQFSTDEYYYDNVLSMHFDNDGSGSFIDSSAYQRTISGNATLSNTQSKFGNSSVYFDGASMLTVPSSSDLDLGDIYTIEAWVLSNDTSRDAGILARGQYQGNQGGRWDGLTFSIRTSSAVNVYFYATNNGNEQILTVPNALTQGQWTHVAVVRNGTNGYVYINGILGGSISNLNTNNASSRNLLIGRWDYDRADEPEVTSHMYFNGYLDDVRITKGVARQISVPVAPSPNLGPASAVPSAPSNLNVSEDQGIVSLSWSRPSSPRVIDTRAPITYYGVEYSSNGGSSWTEHSVVSGGSLLTRSISGLPANTPYLFRVRAQNSVGFGPYSSTANISTLTNAPSGVSAIGDDNQAYVSWTAPTPNNSSIRDYGIQYSTDSGASWYTYSHSPSTNTLINVTGLNNTLNYSFKVAAVNFAGTGIYSGSSSSISLAPRSDNLYNKTRILLHLDSN
jgi:hypothetical protein